MAITRHSTFDKTVQTILDRNNIPNKVNGMTVVVLDAIADIEVGGGKAIYRWDSSDNTWILLSKGAATKVNFITEELIVYDSEVELSYIPYDNKIIHCLVIKNTYILNDLSPNSLIISNGKITDLPSEYNGLLLRITYAYGSITSQISSIIDSDEIKTHINPTEFKTNLKRNGKNVFGVEIDCGNLPDSSEKNIGFLFNSDNQYWIDGQNSYCYNTFESYPLNYVGNIGDSISCKLDLINNNIILYSSKNRTNLAAKVVLLYTKGV